MLECICKNFSIKGACMTFEEFQESFIQDKSPQIRGSLFEVLSKHMLEKTDTENVFEKVDLFICKHH